MNSLLTPSPVGSMNVEQALNLVNAAMLTQIGRGLNDVETAILQGAWQSQTYEQIADISGYSVSYLTRDVGPKFWKLLSQSLQENVSKTSFRAALERRWRKEEEHRHQDVKPDPNPENHLSKQALSTADSVAAPQPQPLPTPAIAPQAPAPPCRCDWGEAVDVSTFCGRHEELNVLQQWIMQDGCRLVALLGMGGIGKSSLSVKLAQAVQAEYDVVIWRSLRNAPRLDRLVVDLTTAISARPDPQADLRQLMQWLRSSRCLIILDNVETILQAGDHAGRYRPGYEHYGEFFRFVAESAHQSCLVLTSREKPAEVAAFEGIELAVRSMQLSGSVEVAEAVLAAKSLAGSSAQKQQLCQQYGYNPLALKIVATSIQELFDGEIQAFLAEDTAVFSNIRKLLDQHFDRLSSLEQSIMYWLAINREWTPIAELADDIVPTASRAALIEALESLSRRSLIEKQTGCYTQQSVVMEYITDRLVEQVCSEIINWATETTELVPTHLLLQSHALIKAQSKDYIRTTQIHLILQAVIHRLQMTYRSEKIFQEKLLQIRSHLQQNIPYEPGYAGGNLLNLLCQTKADLAGLDFSRLSIWQAYLPNTHLHQVNFTQADLKKSVFATTLSAILSVATSPNGQLLATADVEGEVRLWQAIDGQLLYTFKEHQNWVHTVQFSPDGQQLASGSEDETIRLWNLHTQECTHILRGHSSRVWCVAYSPDSQLLASSSEDGSMRVWDTQTGECLTVLRGHSAGVYSVTFVSQNLLASSSADQTIKLWEISDVNANLADFGQSADPTGECVATLQGHTDGIWSIAVMPLPDPSQTATNEQNQSYLLASGSRDRTIRLWQINTQIPVEPGSQTLDSATVTAATVTTECIELLPYRFGWVWSVAFSPDGQTLASAGDDGTILLWEVQKILARRRYTNVALSRNLQSRAIDRPRLLKGHTSRVWSIAFTPNQPMLVSGSKDQTVRIWDLTTNHCIRTLKGHTNWVQAVALSPDSQLVASGHEDKQIRLWNTVTGDCVLELQGHTRPVWSIAFSPTSDILASCSEDQSIRLWNIKTGECQKVLQEHTSRIWSVAFSPNGQTIASGSSDQTIRLWNAHTGECIATLKGHTSRIWSVAFSPDGQTIASGSSDQTVRLWNAHTGECKAILTDHQGWIFSVAFSPDSQSFASASSDHTVRMWDLQTRQCLRVIQDPTRLMLSIQFSADGETIAAAGDDHTIKLWNINSGECLKALSGHIGWVWSIDISANDQQLVSASQDETIKIWNLATGTCTHTLKGLRPYEGMKITDVTGITEAQRSALHALGATS
ncbi:MAG: NB-ARC domain-containing protein [Elainellaceae cyanobacterium]